MASAPNAEKAIFLAALDKATPAERDAFLDQACAGDAALRQRVEALLHAADQPDSLLDQPAAAPSRPDAPAPSDATQSLAADNRGGPDRPEADDADGLAFLQPPSAPDSLGRLDHYEVLSLVGKGGMGVVFKALDTSLRRVVALKVLAPQLANSGAARQRFVREARAAAAVTHDHVIDIHAVEERGPVPYLVMQFIDGRSVDDKIKAEGPLPLREALRIGIQIAAGLAAAHKQGLIHRDVKPANILLENGVERVKLTDFGLARAADDASLTRSGVIAGTPAYMSPEQARGDRLDARSDLFSLGGVLYTMLTGRMPFRAPNAMAVLKRVCDDAPRPVRESNPDVPEWLEAVVARLLAKEAAARFQTAAEVADLLSQQLAHLQGESAAPPPSLPGPARPTPALRPWRPRRLAGVAAVVGLAAAVGAAIYCSTRPPRPNDPDAGTPKEEPPRQEKPFSLDLSRDRIPPALLALAGGGDPDCAPPELAAVLGDGRFVLPREGHTSWMAVSPDGQLLAVPHAENVVLFNARTGAPERTLTGHTSRVYTAAFSPDGDYLAAGNWGKDNLVKVWEVHSGRVVLTLDDFALEVRSVAFSPDGRRLAAAGGDRVVTVWDAKTGRRLHALKGHTDCVYAVAFSPDGKRIVSASRDRTAAVWDGDTGEKLSTLRAHTDEVRSVAFGPDGALLATGSDAELKLWDGHTFQEVGTLPTPVQWVAFTPDGRAVLAGKHTYPQGGVHQVARWDVATRKRSGAWPLQSEGGFAVYALSPDGKTLFAMRCDPADPIVRAYDIATGKELFPREGHTGPVHTAAVSPDGRTLASGGADKTVRLWDLATGKVVRTLTGHAADVFSLAFSPDGKLLASGSFDSTIILWDAVAGKEVRTLAGHAKNWSLIAFSPDGQTVAAGSEDGRVRLWDASTGKPLESLHWHEGQVRAVAFSPDGKRLASVGQDKLLQLCDAATGRCVRTIRNPNGFFFTVAFSPDGK